MVVPDAVLYPPIMMYLPSIDCEIEPSAAVLPTRVSMFPEEYGRATVP
jgi:hypothetical protein